MNRTSSFCLLLYSFLPVITGCWGYTDVPLHARKEVFYTNSSDILFQNISTGQSFTLQANEVTCHSLSPYEVHTGYNSYTHYYPELCGQIVKSDAHELNWLDHSISSEVGHYMEAWHVNFQNAQFSITKSTYPSAVEVVHFDSLMLDGTWYFEVYIMQKDTVLPIYPRIDSVYFSPNVGVLKLVSSNNESWLRR